MAEEKGKRKKQIPDKEFLLLGGHESGKSTIFTQTKIIHSGLSENQRSWYKIAIAYNILDTMRILVQQAQNLGHRLSPENETPAKMFEGYTRDQGSLITPEICAAIESLWGETAIKQAFVHCNEYPLNESSKYFIENIKRIADNEYIPTEHDVLRTRVRTTGIVENIYQVGSDKVAVLDIGGGPSERRKWVHSMGDATGILFCVALSDMYDLKLYEDDNTNRMEESLRLFKDMCDAKVFANTPIVLLLNKVDIFKEKIQRVPITVCFPEYKGPNSFEATSNYIFNRFLEQLSNKQKTILAYFTCALDTTNINIVLNSVYNIILFGSRSYEGAIPTIGAGLYYWTPQTHNHHSAWIKDAIFCTLLVAKQQKWPFDSMLMHKILCYVAHGWFRPPHGFDFPEDNETRVAVKANATTNIGILGKVKQFFTKFSLKFM